MVAVAGWIGFALQGVEHALSGVLNQGSFIVCQLLGTQ